MVGSIWLLWEKDSWGRDFLGSGGGRRPVGTCGGRGGERKWVKSSSNSTWRNPCSADGR